MENLEIIDVLEEERELEVLAVEDETEETDSSISEPVEIGSIGIQSDELIERQRKTNAKSLKNKKEESYKQLLKYKDLKTILWSEIDSVELDVKNNMVGIITYWNGLRVCIPDVFYFEPNFRFPEKYYDASTSVREKLNIKRVIASYQTRAKICFVIENITHEKQEDGSYVYGVIGNRVKAMECLRDIFFVHEKYFPGMPVMVNKGDIAEAHILSVTPDRALAECLGVEVRIDRYAMSNDYIENCRDVVKSGDSLKVRIRNYRINDDGSVNLYVSGRMNKPSHEIQNMKKNSTYTGTITAYHKEKGRYTARLKSGVNAFIKEQNVVGGKMLSVGDEVVILITYIGENSVAGNVMSIF